MSTVSFYVNQQLVTVDEDLFEMPLMEYLQDEMGLTGTKFCCGIGVCRACTVSVQRQPNSPREVMLSCSTPLSQMQGVQVDTIESVGEPEKLHPLQQAFLDKFAFQCGYCTSGFLMAAYSLWDRLKRAPINKDDLDQVIENAVGEHICRCTGYIRYHEAIKSAIIEEGGMVS
ncbi:(2Fe-2S)-binding protein [Curvivirga sp.]|uniref:(2Fe-2S)-binding protein n=1 Tax=Curvivirga sp. TaxID=2856848 RepID=UPI003B58BBB6